MTEPESTTTEIPSRLHSAAAVALARWDPTTCGIVDILARVAPATGSPDSADLWDVVVTHLGEELTVPWERAPGRTRQQVAAMLRNAAASVQDGEAGR